MANEVQFRHTVTGVNLYFFLQNNIPESADYSKYWRVSDNTWQAAPAALPDNFDTVMTEIAGSYNYQGTFPTNAGVTEGNYTLYMYLRIAGAPALTDTLLAINEVYWDLDNIYPSSAGIDTDSTGTEVISMKKAVEVMLAVLIGDSVVAGDNVSWKGRDGATETSNVDFDADGNRTNSTIT
jgi:hypothetical protein